jgi:hypothetical protein
VSPSAEAATRALESVSLICAVSHKRLTKPVLLKQSSAIVERGVASLLIAGGDLYRPSLVSGSEPTVEAVEKTLCELLSRTVEFRPSSIHILYIEKLRTTLPAWSPSLETAGRDFIVAIKRANQTDLVSRGPLELKSAEVIPPQVVLDGEVHRSPNLIQSMTDEASSIGPSSSFHWTRLRKHSGCQLF